MTGIFPARWFRFLCIATFLLDFFFKKKEQTWLLWRSPRRKKMALGGGFEFRRLFLRFFSFTELLAGGHAQPRSRPVSNLIIRSLSGRHKWPAPVRAISHRSWRPFCFCFVFFLGGWLPFCCRRGPCFVVVVFVVGVFFCFFFGR